MPGRIWARVCAPAPSGPDRRLTPQYTVPAFSHTVPCLPIPQSLCLDSGARGGARGWLVPAGNNELKAETET